MQNNNSKLPFYAKIYNDSVDEHNLFPINWIKNTFFKSEVSPFESVNHKIPDECNFTLLFPNLIKEVINYDNFLFKSRQFEKNDIYKSIRDSLCLFEKDIFFIDYWTKLNNIHNGKTSLHIFMTLVYCHIECKQTENIKYVNDYDYNILLWSLLLHDISKHIKLNNETKEEFINDVNPADKIHPFKSAASCLKIFNES